MLLICKAKVSAKCLKVVSVSPMRSSATREIICAFCKAMIISEPSLGKQDTIATILERKADGKPSRNNRTGK